MMPSTYRDSTRAVSAIGSPRPSCTSRGERNSACPPSCHAPTSNDTRVRVDDFIKIIASDFPASGFFLYLPVRIDSASENKRSSSFAEKSGICSRSRCGCFLFVFRCICELSQKFACRGALRRKYTYRSTTLSRRALATPGKSSGKEHQWWVSLLIRYRTSRPRTTPMREDRGRD